MDTQKITRTWPILALGLGLFAASIAFLTVDGRDATPTTQQAQQTATETAAPAIAPADAAERSRVAALGGFYSAPVGQVVRYGYRAESTVDLRRRDDAGGAVLQVALAGEMQLVVLARTGDELLVELSFPRTGGSITTNGSKNPLRTDDALVADLASSTVVRMRDDGTTLGYAFAAGVAAEHRNWIRGLWSACRLVVRPTPNEAWTTVEDDVVGPADLEYRWREPIVAEGRATGGKLARKKLGYGQDRQAELGAMLASGDGEAWLNPDLGWFERARWSETVTRRVDEIGALIRTTFAAEWSLQELDWRDGVADEALWRTAWLPVGGADDSAASGRAAELQHQRQRLAGVTVEQLLADLATLCSTSADPNEIYGKKVDLTWLLRLEPDAPARLDRLLPGLDQATAGLAISALGATELPEAHAIVARLFADPTQSIASRQSAAWSTTQISEPDAATIAAFTAVLRDRPTHDAGDAAGVLALGTMVGRANGQAQLDGFAALLALEPAARRSGALANWIEALGNAGLPAVLDIASRHRTSEELAVRAAAVSAVRSVPGAEALALAIAATDDEAALVRARAAEVLAERREPQALDAVDALLQREADARVRGAALNALAGRLAEPRTRALVQRAAERDADAAVRELAAGLLRR
jgi:hypothetical protein